MIFFRVKNMLLYITLSLSMIILILLLQLKFEYESVHIPPVYVALPVAIALFAYGFDQFNKVIYEKDVA